jgi:hypothetical protein
MNFIENSFCLKNFNSEEYMSGVSFSENKFQYALDKLNLAYDKIEKGYNSLPPMPAPIKKVYQFNQYVWSPAKGPSQGSGPAFNPFLGLEESLKKTALRSAYVIGAGALVAGGVCTLPAAAASLVAIAVIGRKC